MTSADSSPMMPEDGLGNGKSQKEIGALGIQEQIDNEVENEKIAESSHYAGNSNQPEPYTLFCDPADYSGYPFGFSYDQWHQPISGVPSEVFGYDYEDMYAEEAVNMACDHANDGGGFLKEVCDENSHVDGGNYGEAVSSRVICVPSPKVGLVVGAVATLRFLQPNFGDRIRIMKDSEVDIKCALKLKPVEITGTIAQLEFAEQLIAAVLAEDFRRMTEEPMEEETQKPSSQKDGEALIEEVHDGTAQV